jgi:hypothetical protein
MQTLMGPEIGLHGQSVHLRPPEVFMRFDVCLHLYLRGSCQACITNCQLIQATGTVHNWSYTSLFGNSLLYLVSNLGPACLAITCATATVTAIALGLRRKFGSDRGPWPQSTYCLAAQLQMGKGGKAKGKGKADGKGGKGKGIPADPYRSCMTWLRERKHEKHELQQLQHAVSI